MSKIKKNLGSLSVDLLDVTANTELMLRSDLYINVFLNSYLVLHYLLNFVTCQTVIGISVTFQVLANLN